MPSPASLASQIRGLLKQGGYPERASGIQWFFKDAIKSHGWRTSGLRRSAGEVRKRILADGKMSDLLAVADNLFSGRVLEEKVFGILLLERDTDKLGSAEFRRFESWLDRISSWADHDGLVHYLLGPLVLAEPGRTANVFRWAKSKDRWHRRAAAVSLVRGARNQMFAKEIPQLSNLLLQDEDDMVQKGLGWLLREWAKKSPEKAMPYLMKIRTRAPRLVLRTACEKLRPQQRARVLLRDSERPDSRKTRSLV